MNDFAMYTPAGDDAIAALVREASILRLDWPAVLAQLTSLAHRFPEDFGEATDTAVREAVYDALRFETPFYI